MSQPSAQFETAGDPVTRGERETRGATPTGEALPARARTDPDHDASELALLVLGFVVAVCYLAVGVVYLTVRGAAVALSAAVQAAVETARR